MFLLFSCEKDEYQFDFVNPEIPKRTKRATVLINNFNLSFNIEVGNLDE